MIDHVLHQLDLLSDAWNTWEVGTRGSGTLAAETQSQTRQALTDGEPGTAAQWAGSLPITQGGDDLPPPNERGHEWRGQGDSLASHVTASGSEHSSEGGGDAEEIT